MSVFKKLTLLSSFALIYILSTGFAYAQQPSGFIDPNIDATVFNAALQTGDGKIIVSGDFSTVGGQTRRKLARLNVDGSLDTTFTDPAIVGSITNDRVFALELQPDGRILVGGLFNSVGGQPKLGLARINSDGTLDSSFQALLNAGVSTIDLQPDGKILIAGSFTNVNSQARKYLARLNADGSLDASFQPADFGSAPNKILVQTDGRILCVGHFDTIAGQPRLGIARLNADGALDASFNVTVNSFLETALQQTDGKLVIAGSFSSVNGQTRKRIARLNLDGTLDTSFQDPDVAAPSTVYAIRQQLDGKILAGGDFTLVAGQDRPYVARFNTNGLLDTSFLNPNLGGIAKTVYTLEAQPDGKILIGGAFETVGGRSRKRLARLNANGSVDQAPATVFTVSKPDDTNDGVCNSDCSLREAVAAANANAESSLIVFDATVFGSAAQTITLSGGEIPIGNPRGAITLAGTTSDLLTISGNNQSRIFNLNRDSTVSFKNMTMANGNATLGDANYRDGGAVYIGPNNAGLITIENCIIRNSIANNGGGIYAFGLTTVNLVNSTVTQNTAIYNPGGGGIYFYLGTLSITNSIISNNTTTFSSSLAGGIYAGSSATLNLNDSTVSGNSSRSGGGITNEGPAFITNSRITGNTADSGSGGGIYSGNGNLTVNGSLIQGNQASISTANSTGGGIYSAGRAAINNSNINGNSAPNGGGIANYLNLSLSGTTISGNNANSGSGGGIYNFGSGPGVMPAAIQNSLISNNTASQFGGGVYNRSILNVSNSTLSGNTSASGGGAAFNYGFTVSSAILSLTSSTVANNRSNASGGAFQNQTATINLTNSTVSKNTAAGMGGGLMNTQGGAINLTFATIAFNIAGTGGGLVNPNATANSNNSIIAGNTGRNAAPDVSGLLNSQGFNLIGNSVGMTLQGDTTGNKIDVNAGLDPILRGSGGTMVHALLPFSPAIDAGNSPVSVTTDQQGRPRPFDLPSVPNAPGSNAADIGAFERQSDDAVFSAAPFDFDGDNKTDIGIFRPSDGSWWYTRSGANDFRVYSFGASTDIITPGDFTGDGKADIAIFRPSTGTWFIQRSEDNSFFSFPFGAAGDVPAPADYDADGKTDAAVFRPSSGTWFIQNSGGSGTTIVQFGSSEDKPVPADFDGDGKADVAIFRPSDGSWWYLRSSDGGFRVFRFGVGTDKPVQGDYTGDGKADIAVFRPSTGEWFFQRSEDNSYYSVPFGASGDIPAPGDYDGDGKFDTAVFRPSGATWYVNRTAAGLLITNFGANGDRPIPSAFVP